MKSFNQYSINAMATYNAEDENEYKLLVCIFTWLAHNRGMVYDKPYLFTDEYSKIVNRRSVPFHILKGLVLRVGRMTYNTFPYTGEYNVITNVIFRAKYTTEERYNYIKLVSNISPVHRLNCKLYKKPIILNRNIVTLNKQTPLIEVVNNTIHFPYEEEGVKQWQIGQEQRKQKAEQK